jgi:uncharacterized cupredoxin-like copper-binding protein
MMRGFSLRLWPAALGVSLLVASCAIPAGYVKDPIPWLETADWSKVERIRVAMSEYRFTPQVLSFEEGKPYVLEIENAGKERHNFAAEKFFRAVAVREIRVPGAAALDLPSFATVELQPGGIVDIAFVAVRPGEYDMVSSEPGDAQKGLIGAAQILRAIGGSR